MSKPKFKVGDTVYGCVITKLYKGKITKVSKASLSTQENWYWLNGIGWFPESKCYATEEEARNANN